jgi:hypothetical protein
VGMATDKINGFAIEILLIRADSKFKDDKEVSIKFIVKE